MPEWLVQFTNVGKDFKGTLDYILYTTDSLAPVAMLELPDDAEVAGLGFLPSPSSRRLVNAGYAKGTRSRDTMCPLILRWSATEHSCGFLFENQALPRMDSEQGSCGARRCSAASTRACPTSTGPRITSRSWPSSCTARRLRGRQVEGTGAGQGACSGRHCVHCLVVCSRALGRCMPAMS